LEGNKLGALGFFVFGALREVVSSNVPFASILNFSFLLQTVSTFTIYENSFYCGTIVFNRGQHFGANRRFNGEPRSEPRDNPGHALRSRPARGQWQRLGADNL
jgi:hypothetical protein